MIHELAEKRAKMIVERVSKHSEDSLISKEDAIKDYTKQLETGNKHGLVCFLLTEAPNLLYLVDDKQYCFDESSTFGEPASYCSGKQCKNYPCRAISEQQKEQAKQDALYDYWSNRIGTTKEIDGLLAIIEELKNDNNLSDPTVTMQLMRSAGNAIKVVENESDKELPWWQAK